MLTVAICDDNPVFLAEISSLLTRWPGKPANLRYECFSDGDSLLRAHLSAPFDVILIDVLMPLLNGIETAKELRLQDQHVKIVFLTSSPEFAVESYKVKASNYLLKPIDAAALHICLDELYADLRKSVRTITVRSTNAVHRVELDNIELIEAQNKHVLLYLTNGTFIESIQPLYYFVENLLLSDGFCKCHRSYIVNLNQIRSYTATEIITHSGNAIRISRSYHKDFESAYFSLLFDRAGDVK